MIRSRLSVKLLALYLVVVFLSLGLFLPRPFPGGEEAVPVFRWEDGTQRASSPWISILLTWGSPPLFGRPVWGGSDAVAGPGAIEVILASGRSGMVSIIEALTGVEWLRPSSLMASSIPSMFATSPRSAPALAPLDPVVYLPVPAEKDEGGSQPEPDDDREEIITPPGGADHWPPPDQPLVVIYHTHTMESFLPVLGLSGGNPEKAFSTDSDLNIVAVGETLARILADQHGIGVIHVLEYFDMDERTGRMQRLNAYARAETYMTQLVERYPGAPILVDLHRDSPRGDRTILSHPDGDYARVLLVVGTDQTLAHQTWRQNLTYATQVAEIMEDLVPGIMRGIEPSIHRYNQHLSPAALLVELGGVDNTPGEVERSIRILAQAIAMTVMQGTVPGLELTMP